jgi:hypothetical protein
MIEQKRNETGVWEEIYYFMSSRASRHQFCIAIKTFSRTA